MDEINIENIVFSTKISNNLDIEKLSKIFSNSRYDINDFSGLIIDFDNPKCAIFISSNGKFVCTGLKNFDDIEIVLNKIIDDIEKNHISIFEDVNITIENIIASNSIVNKFDLDALSKHLDKVEYTPENFPGLVYHIKDSEISIILFESGKIVYTGAKKTSEISAAFNNLLKELSSIDLSDKKI
jgi:transcription initiation factor TFIID TATA-box-binding protein